MGWLRPCLWKHSIYWVKVEACPNPRLQMVILWSLQFKERKGHFNDRLTATWCATREADMGQGEVLPHTQRLLLSSVFQEHVVGMGCVCPWARGSAAFLSQCSESFTELQRWGGSPWRGWCRRTVGVSFLPVLSLGGCSTLSGTERLLSSPEQPMWLQKCNKFLVFVLFNLSFWTSSLFLSLNHLY